MKESQKKQETTKTEHDRMLFSSMDIYVLNWVVVMYVLWLKENLKSQVIWVELFIRQ